MLVACCFSCLFACRLLADSLSSLCNYKCLRVLIRLLARLFPSLLHSRRLQCFTACCCLLAYTRYGARSTSWWVYGNQFWQLSWQSAIGNLHVTGRSHATTASLKPSFRAAWRVGDAVVGRRNVGWTTSKSGHSCPYQNCWQGPPTEKTGRGSLLNRPSPDDSIGQGTELNWTAYTGCFFLTPLVRLRVVLFVCLFVFTCSCRYLLAASMFVCSFTYLFTCSLVLAKVY